MQQLSCTGFISQALHISYAHMCAPNMHKGGLFYMCKSQEHSAWAQLHKGFSACMGITLMLLIMMGCQVYVMLSCMYAVSMLHARGFKIWSSLASHGYVSSQLKVYKLAMIAPILVCNKLYNKHGYKMMYILLLIFWYMHKFTFM